MGIDNTELSHRFEYHPPKDQATVQAHEAVRSRLYHTAAFLNELLPEDRPRECALVQTHLEEAMMWANAASARSRTGVDDG